MWTDEKVMEDANESARRRRAAKKECRRLMKQMSRYKASYFHSDGWPSYRRRYRSETRLYDGGLNLALAE